MRIKTHVDHRLRVDKDDLPAGVEDMIKEALSIPNREKEEAKKNDLWGWRELPDRIELWDESRTHLSMPRGFALNFRTGLGMLGHEPDFIDHRYYKPLIKIGQQINTKPWQKPAVDAILQYHQGIYKAPAGSGKTVSVLAAIQKLGCRSLVIVNTKDILWQWQERVQQFLGTEYPVGLIGDNEFNPSKYLTIATAQTLHSRYDELVAAGFFDEFSLVCLDECHHATADTYNRLINRFSSRYRIGVSATPDKTGDFLLATAVLGPIFHETKVTEVTSLIRPQVVRVTTDFFFSFRGGPRGNYQALIKALINNRKRNELIVQHVRGNRGHHQLVITKRIEHIEILKQMLLDSGFTDPIYTIIGDDKNEARQDAKAFIEEKPCVILSTLADEALDIPRLDRLHLVYPQKNTGLITQQVGRVERAHPNKKDAVIYDYADLKVSPLAIQWRERQYGVYKKRSYNIKIDTLYMENGKRNVASSVRERQQDNLVRNAPAVHPEQGELPGWFEHVKP